MFDASLSVEQYDKNYTAVFRIKNLTDKHKTLFFSNGQRYDYLLSRGGEKIVKYSEGKFFIMAVQEIIMEQGEELVFRETLPALKPGTYLLEFWLTAKNQDIRSATEFKIIE